MSEPIEPRRRRLDEMAPPGWAGLSSNLLRGGGLLVGAFVLWLGFLTGGFFLILTGVLAAIAVIGGWLLGGLVMHESWIARPNARPLSFALVVAFPVALMLFAQVAGPLLTPPAATSACLSGTLARDGERHDPIAADPRIETMRFRLQVNAIAGGALRYFVQDPTGQSAWSGRAETTGWYESEPIAAVGGQWTVNLISEADEVSYRLDWFAATAGAAGSSLTRAAACAGAGV